MEHVPMHDVHADGAFAKEIGSRAGRSAEHLKYGLWLAGQQLSGNQKASKAIHIYSNNLDPSAGGKPKDKCAPQPLEHQCHSACPWTNVVICLSKFENSHDVYRVQRACLRCSFRQRS